MSTAVPTRVGVIGGGRMGAGIAQVFLAAGAHVAVVEAGGQAADAARGRVADGLAEAARRGKLDGDVETVLGRLTLLETPAGLGRDTDLVIEAVPERADLKAEVLGAAAAAAGPAAVLATNTSSLSVSELAAALERPSRFLGMHFFNPVPASSSSSSSSRRRPIRCWSTPPAAGWAPSARPASSCGTPPASPPRGWACCWVWRPSG